MCPHLTRIETLRILVVPTIGVNSGSCVMIHWRPYINVTRNMRGFLVRCSICGRVTIVLQLGDGILIGFIIKKKT